MPGKVATASTWVDFIAPLIATVGGYLGAGKTTLVNTLLSKVDGKRVVVFVNDFGEINIDYHLIATADTDRIDLKNGCVCCSLNDDLIESVTTFCRDDPPDAFIVEASGVSDPRSLDQSILSLQSAGYVSLSNRVYILDADQFSSLDYDAIETIVDHAAASQLVLINKTDLVDEEKSDALEALIRRSTRDAEIRRTIFCDVDLDVLFSAHSGELGKNSIRECGLTTSDQSHDDRYSSWSKTIDHPMKRTAILGFLQALSGSVSRAKGIYYCEDDPTQAVAFDLVGTRFSTRVIDNTAADDLSRLLVIGTVDQLKSVDLESVFDRFFSEYPDAKKD